MAQDIEWTYTPPSLGIAGTSTAVRVKAAAMDGQGRIVVDQITLGGSSNTAMEFTIQSSGGTVIWRQPITTAGIPSPVTIRFDPPRIAPPGEALDIKCSGSFTGNIYANLGGRTLP
jgi:hypothetical protein